MANVCTNTVTFRGPLEALDAVQGACDEMAAQEQLSGQGQLPPGVSADDGHLFAIDFHGTTVSYDTKGVPNHEVMAAFAEREGVEFTMTFHEPGDLRYGEVTFVGGKVTGIELGDEDFEAYEQDADDEDLWRFEDRTYDAESDILEILLQRRKDQRTA